MANMIIPITLIYIEILNIYYDYSYYDYSDKWHFYNVAVLHSC